jgi:hypothetical protein
MAVIEAAVVVDTVEGTHHIMVLTTVLGIATMIALILMGKPEIKAR